MTPDFLLYAAIGLGFAGVVCSLYVYFGVRRMLSVTHGRTRGGNQALAEIATLKREVTLLSETVSRFRTQSLAGISEVVDAQESRLRDNLRQDIGREVTGLTGELDRAIKAVVERVERKHGELLEQVDEKLKSKPDAQVTSETAANSPELAAFARASVQDRFIASLENPDDRRKCLLSSLDTVLDIPTLGKLAVAYPSLNSWMILKELADHGVVSDVAGWALLAGAELSLAKLELKLAEQLYQAARLSFVIGGREDHEGLFFVSGGLARVLNDAGEDDAARSLARSCETHLEALRAEPPSEPGSGCAGLADYYMQDERYACAAILYMRVISLCRMLDHKSDFATRAWLNLSKALRALVRASAASETRERFDYLGGEAIDFLSEGLAEGSPLREAGEKEGVQLCLLRLTARENNSKTALSTIVSLMNQLESGRMSKDHKAFLAGEVLNCLDDMGLSRKAVGLPILKQLVDVFMRAGNFARAASAGAKLVDVSLDLFGDASLETVAPIELLARVYKAMQRFDLAEECYRQILEVQYKVYPGEHEQMIEVLLSLAEVCLIQKDRGESEIFVESAQEMVGNLFAPPEEGETVSEDDEEERKGKADRINQRIDGLKAQLVAAG